MSPVLAHGADTTIQEGYLTKAFATCSNKGEMRGMCWSMGQILSHGGETWYFSSKSSATHNSFSAGIPYLSKYYSLGTSSPTSCSSYVSTSSYLAYRTFLEVMYVFYIVTKVLLGIFSLQLQESLWMDEAELFVAGFLLRI